MTRNNLKEISYYLFFALMIFAKGIGLDSGDKIYYVLSAFSCICVVVKLVLTKYNWKQAMAMILLCLVALISYRNSGRMGLVLSVLAIIGIKDINIQRLFRMGAAIYVVSFVTTVTLAATGIINNPLVVHEKGELGEVIRWGMGYSTGNVFHISYFILVVFLSYTSGKNYNVRRMIGLMLGNVVVFIFSLSYTGAAVTSFYLLLNIYAVKRKFLSRGERILCQLPLPLCILFSFFGPFLLEYPFIQKIDVMLQARLSFAQYYLQNQPITLFGTRMKDVPNFWIIMDNGYVYILMTFGIVAFALFGTGYSILIARYSKVNVLWRKEKGSIHRITEAGEERLPELAIIFSFMIYGIMEQFISNAFMNISLLFMGCILFGEVYDIERACNNSIQVQNMLDVIKKKNRRLFFVSSLVGIITLTGYLLFGSLQKNVIVPLTSLNYVDAQSVTVNVSNKEGTKDELKMRMQQCQSFMEDERLVQEALQTAEVTDRLTVEQVREALEFSLPQSVHSSSSYDVFRIRILKLYSDIEDAKYEAVLQSLVNNLQNEWDKDNIIADKIYLERVGKSFGDDRIEHIDNNQKYYVEKTGNIVKIEYLRGAVLSILSGFSIGYLLFVIPIVIRYNKGQTNDREKII